MDSEKIFQASGVMGSKSNKKSGGAVFAVVVIIMLLLGVGGIGVWAKTVTDPIAPKEQKAELVITKGEVKIKQLNETEARKANSGDILTTGMTIETAADTEAELRFFDESVARLAPETTLTIERLSHDPQKPTEDKISLSLEIGRVWSRVLNLLSLNSEYTVQSSTTVATVRGTAFDFAVKKDKDGKKWTHVNGADSLVDCNTKKWNGTVKKGDWLHVPEEGMTVDKKLGAVNGVVLGNVIPEAVSQTWTAENTKDDTKYLNDLAEARKQEEARLAQPMQIPVLGAIAIAVAERRIEGAVGSEREALASNLIERKLAAANQFAGEGKSDEALKSFKEARDEAAKLGGDSAVLLREKMNESIGRGDLAKNLGDKIAPEVQDPLMKSVLIENRLRGMEDHNKENPKQKPRRLDLKSIESENNPILKKRFEYLRDWNSKLESGEEAPRPEEPKPEVENVPPAAIKPGEIKPVITKPVPTTIVEPLKIEAPTIVKPAPAPIIEPVKVPSTTINVTVPPPPIVYQPVVEEQVVLSGPSSLQAGDTIQLTATLKSSDGISRDVTRQGTWSATGGVITNGSFEAPIMAGSVTVTFSTKDANGKDIFGKKSVLVEPQLDLMP
ncbi:MAG: FecR domain-containing protein [bacterium]